MTDTKSKSTSNTSKSSGSKSSSSSATAKQQTPATPSAEIPVGSPLPPLYPSRRSDTDALVGHFATVNKGDDQGRYGYVARVSKSDKDGAPVEVIFHTRDARDEDIVVKFADLDPADPGRR